MGYINGTAGLLVMGIWPWLGLAEAAKARSVRSAAISAAALIASTALLTQSRAIVLATVATIVVVLLAAPGRTRRGVNLLIVLAAVAVGAHWTLRVYSSTGPSQLLAPSGERDPAGRLRDDRRCRRRVRAQMAGLVRAGARSRGTPEPAW